MIDLDPRLMTRHFGFSRVISNISGHIWVFLAEDVKAECVLDHIQFLHFRVSAPFLPVDGFCSFVYAKCDYIEPMELWDSLLQSKPEQGPWLVGGDFNVIRDAAECLGTFGGGCCPWRSSIILYWTLDWLMLVLRGLPSPGRIRPFESGWIGSLFLLIVVITSALFEWSTLVVQFLIIVFFWLPL